jgi:NADPH:quinone reductase-like Zn-dependent oxidoreductase
VRKCFFTDLPQVLRIVENELQPPEAAEVRVRVLAASVSRPNVEARDGPSPFPPKPRFTPGYSVFGDVDAIEAGVTSVKAGNRVAALIVYGGRAEYVTVREAKVKAGDRVLIISASGGIGTAFLQLGRVAGLNWRQPGPTPCSKVARWRTISCRWRRDFCKMRSCTLVLRAELSVIGGGQ